MIFLWILVSIWYLLVKYKHLHKWFIVMLTSVLGLWVLLILLNSILQINLPYFVVISLWFICLMPFVRKFKFRFFYIVAIIILHIAIFLWLLYFFPKSVFPITLLSFISLGILITNLAKITRAKMTYSKFKENLSFQDQRYFFWSIEVLLIYFLVSIKSINNYFETGIQNYYSHYNWDVWLLMLFAFVPIVTTVLVLVFYGNRRKKRCLSSTKKTRNFKKQMLPIIKSELPFLIHNVIFVVIVWFLLYSNTNFTDLTYGIFNILFLIVALYLVYEWIIIKIPKITNIAMFSIFFYLIFKYISLLNNKLEISSMVILGWFIFLWIWYVFEKTRVHFHKKIAHTIKDKVEYDF